MQQQLLQHDQFGFDAQPQIVKPKPKYKQPNYQYEEIEKQSGYDNLMFEKRVVRGNTYAANIFHQKQEKSRILPRKAKKLTSEQPTDSSNLLDQMPGTPPPVSGRFHAMVQTEEYIEPLTDKPQESEQSEQTDFFIDRPVNRLFIRKITGENQETQIQEGDLFDFDKEVEPILLVLMNKILEQSRFEVLEEEELSLMKIQYQQFEQQRNSERAEVQRLEQKEIRIKEENERRILQKDTKSEQDQFTHQKLMCRVISKEYLKDAVFNIYRGLEDQGFFRLPLQTSLLDQFLPFIYDEVIQELNDKENLKKQLNNQYQTVIQDNKNIHQQFLEKQNQKKGEFLFQMQLKEQFKQKKIEQKMILKKIKEDAIKKQEASEEILKNIQLCEEKANILSQTLSDLDGFNQDTNFVGLFGGFPGEIYQITETLLQLINENQLKQLQNVQINNELIEKVLQTILQIISTQEGTINIPVSANFIQNLQQIEDFQEITMENLKEYVSDQNKKSIIKDNLNQELLNSQTKIQQVILDNYPNNQFFEFIMQYLIEQFIQNDKLRDSINLIETGEELSKFNGILYICPDITALQFKGTQTSEDFVATDISQVVFENRIRLVNRNFQTDSRFLINHIIAEQVIRQTFLDSIKIENSQNILMQVNQRISLMKQIIVEIIQPNLEQFNIDSY